jgi:non-ribosomal peptide synthetase-like protein
LIACLSVPPNEHTVPADTSWFGSPALLLPRREIFTGFAENQTYVPTLKLKLGRACIDFLKTIVPTIYFFAILALEFVSIGLLLDHLGLLAVFLIFPLIDFGIAIGACLINIAIKWLLLNQYVATAKPAWSFYVWISEFVTGLYDSVSTPLLLDALLGTPFMALFLRLHGAKIGRRVYIDTTYFSEFDLVEIGDDVSLNSECTIQTHLFEDRVMKMAPLKIEDGCTVGSGSIVLYDTIMEKHSSLADLSLLMKGEILPAYTHWEGIPAQPKKTS